MHRAESLYRQSGVTTLATACCSCFTTPMSFLVILWSSRQCGHVVGSGTGQCKCTLEASGGGWCGAALGWERRGGGTRKPPDAGALHNCQMIALYTAWCACISYCGMHSQFKDKLSIVMHKRMPNSSLYTHTLKTITLSLLVIGVKLLTVDHNVKSFGHWC
jgi:hypothetical protein